MLNRTLRSWRVPALALLVVGLGLGVAGCKPAPTEEGKPKTRVEPTGPHAALLRLFPAVGDVTDWKAAGEPKIYGPTANPAESVEPLSADAGAPATAVQGYGYLKSATAKYVRGTAGETLTARVLEMKGSQDAFGIFSVCSSGTTFPSLSTASSVPTRMSTKALSFAKGPYFVQVEYSGTNDATPVLMEFGRYIADQISSPGYRPAILESFPLGSLEGERFYLHTFATLCVLPLVPMADPTAMARALSLSPDTNVAIMGYPTEKPGVSNYLFVIQYPTEADAQAAYKTYADGYLAQSTSPADHNIAVAPPAHTYLAGTFNAEENSVNDQLAKLLAALGG